MEIRYLTKNGVRVYGYKNEKIGSFAISLFLRCGLVYESDKDNGFSHFFEHMVFRNINAAMNGTLYETLDRCALYFNAYTYVNYIEFKITGAACHFDDAAQIICKALEPILIKKSEFDAEKSRIKAEIHEDNPSSLDRFADKIVYRGTPLERSILGSAKNIDSFGIKKLKSAREGFFTTENFYFYCGGNFSESGVSRLCGLIDQADVFDGQKRKNEAPIPLDFGKRKCCVAVKNSPATEVLLSFDVPDGDYTKEELFCISDTLFYGETCPMHRELSENRGLIYSYSPNLMHYGNYSVLSVSYELRADKLLQSVETVMDVFASAKTESEKRLDFAIAFYTDNAEITLDDAGRIVSDFGYDNHIIGCGYDSLETKKKKYSSVRKEKLNELAREIFRPENLVIAIKGNRKKIDVDAIRNAAVKRLG